MKKLISTLFLLMFYYIGVTQDTLPKFPPADTTLTPLVDTIKPMIDEDTTLRIINLNPFFSVHVDSVVNYQFAHKQEYI